MISNENHKYSKYIGYICNINPWLANYIILNKKNIFLYNKILYSNFEFQLWCSFDINITL